MCACRFDLGYNPPKVHGIRVYTVAAPDGEKLTVELEVEWHSLADIALSASFAADRYLMKPVGMAVNLLTSLLPLTVSHNYFGILTSANAQLQLCRNAWCYHSLGTTSLCLFSPCCAFSASCAAMHSPKLSSKHAQLLSI